MELPKIELLGYEGSLENPKFDEATRVHDWRNYVPIMAEENWERLSLETRTYIAYMAKKQAENEEWE